MGVKELFIVALIAAVGLTVALFVTGEAFAADKGLERDAKLGALLSVFCGVLVRIDSIDLVLAASAALPSCLQHNALDCPVLLPGAAVGQGNGCW